MRGQLPQLSLFVLPSCLLTRCVAGERLVRVGLRTAAQARREGWLHPSVLWDDLRGAIPAASLQVSSLHRRRSTSLQRILWVGTCDVIAFPPISTRSVIQWFHREAVQHGHALPCAECERHPQVIGDLCLDCNDSLGKLTEPRLRELNLQNPTTDSRSFRTSATKMRATDRVFLVLHNFCHLWNGEHLVTIRKVYGIASHTKSPRFVRPIGSVFVLFISTQLIIQRHRSMLAAVENPRRIQTFYSTLCICDLGTNGTQYCTWRSCGICSITKSAFTTFEFGLKSKSGRSVESTSNHLGSTVLISVPARFGPGVYSYLEPSLADRWAECSPSSPYRVMLACEINLLPPQVELPKNLKSVSHRTLSFLSRSPH